MVKNARHSRSLAESQYPVERPSFIPDLPQTRKAFFETLRVHGVKIGGKGWRSYRNKNYAHQLYYNTATHDKKHLHDLLKRLVSMGWHILP